MTLAFFVRVPVALLGFAVASVYGIAIALLRRDKSRVAYDYAQLLRRLMQPPLGLRVTVEGEEKLTLRTPCVYIANHQSAYDVPVLAGLYRPGSVVIAKKELRRIPFFGWLYVVTGNILIDRGNRQHSVGRLREAEEAIQQRGVSVWIFPEGTRARTPGRLLPFKKGAFYMAIGARVPLVPIVVSPIKHLFDPPNMVARPGRVTVRVLDPIETVGVEEADVMALMAEARSRMQAALDELTERHLGAATPPEVVQERGGTAAVAREGEPSE